jgi:hypothetical protein
VSFIEKLRVDCNPTPKCKMRAKRATQAISG